MKAARLHRMPARHRRQAVLTLIVLLVTGGAGDARQAAPANPVIPADAVALEGVPQIRIELTRDGADRRELDAAEAARARLSIRKAGDRFYWAAGTDTPLRVYSAGAFTYLSSSEPGRYVRFRTVGDRLEYVEHLDTGFASVTYWGELRVVLDR
jgi:hypothetical protein